MDLQLASRWASRSETNFVRRTTTTSRVWASTNPRIASHEEASVVALAHSTNAENPCKTGVFWSSKGGTRTRDPRLMKPVPSGPVGDGNTSDRLEFGESDECAARTSGADSGAVGARDTLVEADLDRLIELWPMLVADDRAALLAHAERMACGGDR